MDKWEIVEAVDPETGEPFKYAKRIKGK